MALLELRSRPGLRSSLGVRVKIHCGPSSARLGNYALVVGRRCAPAEFFLGAQMVPAITRPRLSDRVCFALGPDRRPDRIERNFARAPISFRRAGTTWRPRVVDFANALLVQLERRIPAFSLRRWSCVVNLVHRRNRACDLFDCVIRVLSFAHGRRPNISQFSMGHLAVGNWFLVNLSRALAAKTRTRFVSLSRRAFPTQVFAF